MSRVQLNGVRHIYSVAAVLVFAMMATASPVDEVRSVLIGPNDRWDDESVKDESSSNQFNSAPMIHESFVPTPIPAPIIDAIPMQPSSHPADASAHQQTQQEQKQQSTKTNHQHSKKKQTVVDRLRDLDRRSNAWFKRTFMGG
ncbi:hypothetical protein LOC67_09755 [Stieleria sp. JC731]|uniref:hypothetical protein n=1 Tax=Pirellulaceae TaxID=2691357 RepID=UPI001E2DD400|nr:hypothetical protein [Stieleria sp. JC731]MCC9600850.1 hypothetical protein [Stieleria sp. JC731]